MLKKILFVISAFFLLFTTPVSAGNDLTVTCSEPQESDFCEVSPPNTPLFSETDAGPGSNFYQSITVNNTDPNDPCFLYLSAGENGDSILKEVLNNFIKRGSLSLYEKTMPELLTSPNPAFLEEIPAGSIYIYDWRVNIDENAGNDYQDRNLSFDISLTFQCGHEPEISPTPTPTPTPTLTPTPTPVINPPDGIILNELMPAPTDNKEWFEIYNTNDFSVTLENWQYDDLDAPGSGSVRDLSIDPINIPAFGFYIIEAGGSYFNNGADFVRLINQNGIEVDSFDYTSYSSTLSWSRQPDNYWCLTDSTKGYANNPCPGGDGSIPTSPPSAPTCDDPKPNTPTNLFAEDMGSGQVSLIWTHPSTPPSFTHYLLAYGPSSGYYLYGNPNIGSGNSYIVSGLTTGAQYCFYVKAINNCMPGDPSNEDCVNIGSTIPILETTPPEGFEEGVLGETEEVEGVVEGPVSGDVGGVSECEKYWLPILYFIAFFVNMIYLNKQASKKPYDRSSLRHILPLILPVIAFFIDTYMLKTRCCKVVLWYCKYFWIGNILSLLIPVYYYNKTK